MKTLAIFVFALFLLCTNIVSGQNQFGSPTVNATLATVLGSVDTLVRCTLVPQGLMKQHYDLHREDTCFQDLPVIPTCVSEQVMILDVPRYKDIRVVVPIVDTLEKIFHDDYGNSLVQLLSVGNHEKQGMALGRFVDLQGNILMHSIVMSDFLIREIIYRWVAHREVCTLVVGQSVYISELIDDIHEVVPGSWDLHVLLGGWSDWHQVPRDLEVSYGSLRMYVPLGIVDGRGVPIEVY